MSLFILATGALNSDPQRRTSASGKEFVTASGKKLYRGGRCRFHGGLSTGPKTVEDKLLANCIAGWKSRLACSDAGDQTDCKVIPEYDIDDVPEVHENAAEDCSVSIDETKVRRLPTPCPTIHLKTLDHVRIEMAKVYRDMKRGKIATQDGTHLTYVLSQIGKLIETGELENRIEALETVLRQRKLPR